MLPLLETAVAFAVAMLAASLFVSAVVQVLQKFGNYRAETVRQMLSALLHGFRVYYNDPDVLAAERDPERRKLCSLQENTFATDILSDPVLHSRANQEAYSADVDELAKQVDFRQRGGRHRPFA